MIHVHVNAFTEALHKNYAASWENQHFAYAKTKTQISFTVTAKLISAFVFATRVVQSLYFLNPKFQASSHLLELYSLVCVEPGRKPERWFSHDAAQMAIKNDICTQRRLTLGHRKVRMNCIAKEKLYPCEKGRLVSDLDNAHVEGTE